MGILPGFAPFITCTAQPVCRSKRETMSSRRCLCSPDRSREVLRTLDKDSRGRHLRLIRSARQLYGDDARGLGHPHRSICR
jgi:hypothetical protein